MAVAGGKGVGLVYEISVCPKCRASLDWCADDGEGMAPRAWCRGSEKHLVIDHEAVRILVAEIARG